MIISNEPRYAFRKNKYLQVRKPCRDMACQAKTGEFVLPSPTVIIFERDAGEVVRQAVADFSRFLLDGMGTPSRIQYNGQGDVVIHIDPTYKNYKCYRIETNAEGLHIIAHDDRGAQQALFHLEFCMRDRRAPFIRFGVVEREPLFSPRMVQSGYAKGFYPDVHLHEIARAGMDAVIIEYTNAETSGGRVYDFNDLIYRAGRYGLDVYLYSMIRCPYPLKDERSADFYDQAYGELFRRYPGAKGVIVVSETSGIQSEDPNATPCNYAQNYTDGVPNHKPSADMWPCLDYAQWIDFLKVIIRKYKPSADIVFWSYNFCNAPEEYRVRLIEQLPTDITLLVTMGNAEKITMENSTLHVTDYSLAVAGPGEIFAAEAAAAKRRGLKLYAMSNTGGRTWDFGVLPYEPMPQQWIRRYQALRYAKEKWGLSGLMESHHYGLWPSFVSELAREAFESPWDDEASLDRVIIRNFGDTCADTVKKALDMWSQAITKITPSSEDQWGAFRTGPAYPFNLIEPVNIPPKPGDGFVGFFSVFYGQNNGGKDSLVGLRLYDEICSLQRMQKDIREGLSLLETVPNPCEELKMLINMGRFMDCCVTTGILAKKWFELRYRLIIEKDPGRAWQMCDEAEALLLDEKENVEVAIKCVALDSRLGYEQIMGYVCSEEKLNWKLRHLEYVIHSELRAYRTGIRHEDTYTRTCLPYTITCP